MFKSLFDFSKGEDNSPLVSPVGKVVQKPWGSYTVLRSEGEYVVKELVINPNQKLSLQRHKHRKEFWTIVSGQGILYFGAAEIDTFEVKKNFNFFIPAMHKHSVEALGTEPLKIIEVWVGEVLDENDIERFEDKYGRI